MAGFNKHGQWSLSGNEDSLLWKTNEKRSAGKNDLVKRKKVDPNSEEAETIFKSFADSIVRGAHGNDKYRQPTNEELFGHLVPSEEEVAKAEDEWHNRFENFFKSVREPIEDQESKDNNSWGNCKSFNDELTQKELDERNGHVG